MSFNGRTGDFDSPDRGSIPRARTSVSKFGAVAHLVERLVCIQEVGGSNPFSSTSTHEVVVGGIP